MATIVPIFQGEVQDNILLIKDKLKYNQWISSLIGDVEIIVRKKKKIRSIKQNKYYWGVVLDLISKHTGEDVEDLHNHFSYKYLSSSGKSGKLHSRKSTTQLSTVEFGEYIDKIIAWAWEFLNLEIPIPSEINQDFEVY